MALENCEPKKVFEFFEEICKIPHGSGNEKALSDYLMDFAKQRGLAATQDEALNVVIKKPGTPGYEKAPAVIIQGHIDMVCVKEADTVHDFLKDPIKAYVDGDFVKAKDTSLGADNGIAVAMAMALLDAGDTIPHPPLEAIFTTDEEVGMGGASALDCSGLQGKIFINADSEDEGVFCASCAGGIRTIYRLPIKREAVSSGYSPYVIKFSGLNGGHSGIMIDQERGNANILMGRILYKLSKAADFRIADISGGSADNSIAAMAECTVVIKEADAKAAVEAVKEFADSLKSEFRFSDPDVKLTIEPCAKPENVFTADIAAKVTKVLRLIPNSIQNMSISKKGLVETSSNLGVVKVTEDAIEMICALRSSVESRKISMIEQIRLLAEDTGAELVLRGDYPEWEYEPNSKIRKLFMDTFNEMYPGGKKAEEEAIHAGLECGWFAKKLQTSEIVSLGPNMYDVHSVSERISISSTQRTWDLLKAVLAKLK